MTGDGSIPDDPSGFTTIFSQGGEGQPIQPLVETDERKSPFDVILDELQWRREAMHAAAKDIEKMIPKLPRNVEEWLQAVVNVLRTP